MAIFLLNYEIYFFQWSLESVAKGILSRFTFLRKLAEYNWKPDVWIRGKSCGHQKHYYSSSGDYNYPQGIWWTKVLVNFELLKILVQSSGPNQLWLVTVTVSVSTVALSRYLAQNHNVGRTDGQTDRLTILDPTMAGLNWIKSSPPETTIVSK